MVVVVYRKVIAVRTVVGVSVTVAVVVSRAVGATVAKKHPKLEKKSLQTK